MFTWSNHARRIGMINRSAEGFSRGLRTTVVTSTIFILITRPRNSSPYSWAQSRSRKRGAGSAGNTFMICCAVHSRFWRARSSRDGPLGGVEVAEGDDWKLPVVTGKQAFPRPNRDEV